MAKDRDYEVLVQQYNIAIAQIKDMKEQHETKARMWSEYEQKCEVTDGHIRKLCEQILAKDRSETSLGDSKSWRSFSTDELIQKAAKVFVRYCKERTDLLQQVMDVAEKRGRENDSLRDQISQLLTSTEKGINTPSTVDEVLVNAERKKAEVKAKEKAPNSLKSAAAEGRVEMILEEDDDVETGEINAIQHMMEKATKLEISPGATPIVSCKQKRELKEQAQQKATMVHLADLQKIMEQFGEKEWLFLEVLGSLGYSKYADIEEELIQKRGLAVRGLRAASMMLVSSGVVSKMSCSLPLARRTNFFVLTDMGKRVYRAHFGNAPVVSEYEKVCAEHDNAEHGYGIIITGKLLEDTGKYESVETYNRSSPITVRLGTQELQYIPDIVCKTRKYTEYIEYERGYHTQQDFSIKCNKMCKVTNYLNFITPNVDAAKRIKNQIDAWIESRGVTSLKRVYIRITTPQYISTNTKWLVQYRLDSGAEPIENAL